MTSSETRGWAQVERLAKSSSRFLSRRLRSLVWPRLASRVEVDVAEDALELRLVGLLDLVEGDVDQLAEVGRVASLVEGREVREEAVDDRTGFLILELD